MSGPADALTQIVTDRNRQIAAQSGPTKALQESLPLSAGGGVFSLDKYLSWMSRERSLAKEELDGPERAGTTVLAVPGAAPVAAPARNPSGALIESYLPDM
jgi:hypothetical protein